MVKKLRERMRSEAGFTFIEIMIVIIIIGFLASVVGPQIIGRLGQARTTTAQNQIGTLQIALDQYYLDNGSYPSTEQGLAALWQKPTLSPVPANWQGPYLQREVPKDPWQKDYQYKSPGEHSPNYDLYTLGKDSQEGGSGENADVTNWSNLQQ